MGSIAKKQATFESVWASLEKLEETVAETSRKVEETSKIVAETSKTVAETSKKVDALSKNLGGLGNLQGRLTEALFEAELWKKFNDIGFDFDSQVSRRVFKNGGDFVAEADFFLENSHYAMPVEVKTELSIDDINEHIERMAKIREYMDSRKDSRKLVVAIAGEIVPENVLRYAHKKGLYVLTQTGDSVAIAAAPHGFEAREW
jgi:uncharacterized coiled-coil protein SlyX